jgi:hypothetical protein
MAMRDFTEKVKEKITGAKDKVEDVKDKVTGDSGRTADEQDSRLEEGAHATDSRKNDPLTEYRDKEPMTPAKIKEHEPTTVKRDITENIAEGGKTGNENEEDTV